jgi:IMP dehydrogenase/GMP reductase
MVSKLKGNWSSQDDMVLWSAGSFHSALTEHAFPVVVVVVLRSVSEHVVIVVQVVEKASDADEVTETVEQMVEQVETGEGEQDLEQLDEPEQPVVELADPLLLPIGVSLG